MKRNFELSNKSQLIVLVLLALLLTVGVFRVFAAPQGTPPDVPSASLYAVTWRTTVMTETNATAAVLSQNYAYQDVSCSFNFEDSQAVTVTLQASNDGSDWFQTHEFTVVEEDTTVTTGIFSRTVSYGRYERMHFELGTSNEVTPTCKSVFSNNWSPPAYAGPIQ